MRATITAYASSVWRLIPASPETKEVVREKARQAVVIEGKNVCYEGLLLAISFIFLLLGLLPPRKNGPREAHLSD